METEQKKPVARVKYNVDSETFVRTWQSSSTVEEVAQKLGMPASIANARAGGYRKKGINLKMMSKRENPHKLDIEKLNQLAQDTLVERSEASNPPGEGQI